MIATQIHTAVVLEARLPLDKWALEPMRYSIGMEKSVFVREARAAFGAAAAASGFGSLPACTPWLDSTMIFWFGQMISQTFKNISVPIRAPTVMSAVNPVSVPQQDNTG